VVTRKCNIHPRSWSIQFATCSSRLTPARISFGAVAAIRSSFDIHMARTRLMICSIWMRMGD
ncbi:MAG: hypothetical protein V4772_19215, partial [Pseudomonadota bacterium]